MITRAGTILSTVILMNVKCTSDHSMLVIAAEGVCSVTATAIKVRNIFLT